MELIDTATECKCGHSMTEHEANECWVDLTTGEGSQNPQTQCGCDWFDPADSTDGRWEHWHGRSAGVIVHHRER